MSIVKVEKSLEISVIKAVMSVDVMLLGGRTTNGRPKSLCYNPWRDEFVVREDGFFVFNGSKIDAIECYNGLTDQSEISRTTLLSAVERDVVSVADTEVIMKKEILIHEGKFKSGSAKQFLFHPFLNEYVVRRDGVCIDGGNAIEEIVNDYNEAYD